jgi:outer membrane lipoprotein SlyB
MFYGLKSVLTVSLLAATVAGCTTQTQPLQNGASVYRASESQRAMYAASCRVVSARYVAVVGDSREDRNRSAATTGVGIVTGALIGNAIGREIGGGSGNRLARNLGTVAGAAIGAGAADAANQRRTTRQGVEYVVALDRGQRRVIVQNLNPGEAPIPAGASCDLVGGRGQDRVVPAY